MFPRNRQGKTAPRIVPVVSGIAAGVLAASLLAATPASAAGKPTPFLGKPVPGHSAGALAGAEMPASSHSVPEQKTALPSPAEYTVDTPSSVPDRRVSTRLGGRQVAVVGGAWQQLGSTGISVAPAADATQTLPKSTKGAIPGSVGAVRAAVVDPKTTKKLGLTGLVLQLSRTDATKTGARVAVRIPTRLLDSLYGADFASRASWVQVGGSPSNAAAARAKAAQVPSVQDAATKSLVLSPTVSSAPVLLAATSAPVSATGTGAYTATSLKPSSTWDVSRQTGDFSWSYPLRVPPAAAGPAPALALTYDSQSVDGETGSTNNQTSAVGEGWSLGGSGFIERTYVSCATDNGASGPVTSSGDLCWKTDNATISFAGHSGQLIRDSASGAWRAQSDDGTRYEHLVGAAAGCAANGTYDTDCWRMTTTDGTQYYFGLNQLPGYSSGKATTNSAWTVPVFGNDPGEPCHGATFAASSCAQAWRWNLDYVVDTHGNAEAFYYNAQTNRYAQGGTTATSYVRGGELDHIDYGFTTGNAYAANAASGRVVFAYDANGRCSDATRANCTAEPASGLATAPAHPTAYPDVPFDQNCPSGACTGLLSPTFWSTAMLTTVTTKALLSGAYASVDAWTLGHSFPDPGDLTSAALWLTQIAHTGYSGSASLTEPATVFTGATLQNRVWVTDGLAPLDKYRITSIQTTLGAIISVNYSNQECTPAGAAAIEASPQTNTARCFPQWWSPKVTPPQAPQKDLFHKYVVTSVIVNPKTGGGNDLAQETDYVYTGTPAWRYETSPLVPDDKRTWSVFAGYNAIEVRVGDYNTPSAQKVTDYTFYQGMDGDRATASGGTKSVAVTGAPGVPDSLWFAGRTRETKVVKGVGGPVVSDTVTTPWASAVTAANGVSTARMTGDADEVVTTPLSTGGSRTVETVTTYDPATGLPTQVNSVPSDATPTCTTTTYAAPNTSAGIVGAVAEVAAVGVSCAQLASAHYPGDAISDTRTSYDGGAVGAAPTKGDATKTEVVDGYPAGTRASAHWITSGTTTYDALGRPLVATDILGRTSTKAYTPAAGAPAGSGATTAIATTNTAPFNWTTTTTYNPAWGVELSSTDANGKVTTATYDALGRRSAVWLPSQPQAANPNTPSTAYSYQLSQTATSSVKTTKLTSGGMVTSYVLYDGLGQPVQTQASAEGGGTVVTDTAYDSHGRTAFTDAAYWTTSVKPSGTLFVPTSLSQIASQTVTGYDAADRTITTTVNSYGKERFHTTVAYPGSDRVDTTPPAGGTPTSEYSNALGQKTKLVQYMAATPTGSATETTTYGYNAQGKMTDMTDPANNHWSWSFDVLGHQTGATDPDTGTTLSTSDAAGNTLTTTDARGVTLAYTYDNLDRKTARYSGSASGPLLASWSYDTVAKGQLSGSTSYTGSTPGAPGAAYAMSITGYDDLYNATGTTVSIPASAPGFGGTTYTTSAYFDTDGSLLTRSLPAVGGLAAERERYSYDFLNNVASLSGTSSYGVATYSAIGQLAEVGRLATNGLTTDFGYDPATGNTAEIKDTSSVSSAYTVQADRSYSRNDAGDVTAIKTTGAAGTDTQCFGYDYLHDLTQAWTPAGNDCAAAPSATTIGGAAPYWTSYGVDPSTGNRTTVTHNPTNAAASATTDTYAYPAAGSAHPHAVQTVTRSAGTGSTDTYGYDASGDTTARPGQSLTYDDNGKLSTVTTGAVTQTNVYDAAGILLLQSDGTNGSTLFLGDTELHVAAGSTTATAVRTYTLGGVPVAERTTKAGVSGSALTWISGDANHTQDLEIAVSSGAVTRRYVDPYGNARGAAASWSSGHGYLNAPTAALSGLTQLGARAYDATIGAFLSVDAVLSAANPQQNNGYSYSANDPVTNADPTGDCYVGSSDSFNFKSNCGTDKNHITHGINQAGPDRSTYGGANPHHRPPAPKPSGPSGSSGRSSGSHLTPAKASPSNATDPLGQIGNFFQGLAAQNGGQCASTAPTRDCAGSAGPTKPHLCEGMNPSSCRDALPGEGDIHLATKDSGSIQSSLCVLVCIFVSEDKNGRATGFGLGAGPRLGAEVDLGRSFADEPGFSGNVSGSAILGGGLYATGGIQNDYSGSSEVIYGAGTALGVEGGFSANVMWTW